MSSEQTDDFVISAHARAEMERRGITEEVVRQVVRAAEQQVRVSERRIVLHSRMMMGALPKMYLVTVYRTTKVDKYWRSEP